MSTTAALSFSLTPDTTKLTFVGGTSTYNSELTIDAEVVSVVSQDGSELSPPVTPDGSQPPLPAGYVPDGAYSSETFDYRMLRRLQNKTSESILVSVGQTVFEVEINGAWVDLSDEFSSGDYSRPISGASQGQVVLEEVAGKPKLNSVGIDYGVPFRWQQCFGAVCIDVFKGYVVEPPTYKQNSGGYYSLTVRLGDELLLKSDTSRVAITKYCGPAPSTAGDAARIYAQTHGLITTSFPPGHSLLDRQAQSFTNERPYDYLQSLYAPTNRDVRCNETGIIVAPRPGFDATQAIALEEKDVIEVEAVFKSKYKPITKIRAKNQFSLVQSITSRQTRSTTPSGDPSNTKAWFQGGYTETTTEQTFLGDKLIWSRDVTRGYVPDTFPVTKTGVEADPCSPTITSNSWQVIETKVFRLQYQSHESGGHMVTARETWVNGKKLKPISDTEYELYDGRISYAVEFYTNTPQINPELCRKDYYYLQTRKQKEEWGLNDDFLFKRLTVNTETYAAATANPDSLTAYVGAGQRWRRTTVQGDYSGDTRSLTIGSGLVEEGQIPPSSEWIRPPVQKNTAFKDVQLGVNGGSVETKPVNAPFCYTLPQIQTFGLRYLRESYGLSKGLAVIAPYWLNVRLGDSITFRGSNYLVFNIEINQTINEATKTLLLSEWVN